jgi:hypothetical protein
MNPSQIVAVLNADKKELEKKLKDVKGILANIKDPTQKAMYKKEVDRIEAGILAKIASILEWKNKYNL